MLNYRRRIVQPLFQPLLVVAILLLSVLQVSAEIATVVEADQVAENWLSYMVFQKGEWAGSPAPEAQVGQAMVVNDTLLGYYFEVEPMGFIVVPALKELPPIKAYSERCRFDINEAYGFPALLKEVLLNRMNFYARAYGDLGVPQPDTGEVVLGRGHRLEWDRFLQTDQEFEDDLFRGRYEPMTEVGPLLTTSWHQRAPYSNNTPRGDSLCDTCSSGNDPHSRTLVGCVALAASQIMNYWEWPPYGRGSYSYTWTGDSSCRSSTASQTLSVTLSDTYDWANMPDSCDDGCSAADSAALAELCYEVGVTFNMNYGVCGSGAYTGRAVQVFRDYFYYDNAIEKVDRSDTTATGWFGIIKTEINNDRPMEYRISNHAIVCDGWRDTGGLNQYHMNYGWGNSFNAWYSVDSLWCSWETDSLCPWDEEYLVRYIQPAAEVLLCDTLYDGKGGPLTEAGGPYLITCNALVPTGQTLTIQSGAVVYFDYGKKVTVDGTLNASGTQSKPVKLYSKRIPRRGLKIQSGLKLQNGEELRLGS
ncbi:MAG: C10 family peptidase [Candidatus Zixiibacteriota bacterium]|nr:MAG: C10 family peptidase [candidate division Zixibacteria bacterium]